MATDFPRRDWISSHDAFVLLQFLHGCSSIALQRTRRLLQALQAFFARNRSRVLGAVPVALLVILLRASNGSGSA
jgi:hypothetical protein